MATARETTVRPAPPIAAANTGVKEKSCKKRRQRPVVIGLQIIAVPKRIPRPVQAHIRCRSQYETHGPGTRKERSLSADGRSADTDNEMARRRTAADSSSTSDRETSSQW